MLIAPNIDLAAKIDSLQVGDTPSEWPYALFPVGIATHHFLPVGDTPSEWPYRRVSVKGEYEWSDRSGLIHWTHHDPRNVHEAGWIEHNNLRYE